MDKGKYKFDSLNKKYDGFRGAAFSVKIDGKEYKSTELPLDELEVDICGDGSAGGCRFTISNYYDQTKTQFVNDLVKSIKAGSKLEVKCGYVKQEDVFYGYVDECAVEMSENNVSITVTGIDGFGFLMSCKEPFYGGNKKPKNVVEELLRKAVSAGYAKSIKVGAITAPQEPVPPVKEQVDDFKYLRLLAERYCMSLLCIDGELIFDKVSTSTSPIISLSMRDGLLSFTRRLSLHGQVGKVVVWGRDVNQKFIKGEATKVSAPGTGKSALDIAPKFKTAVSREFCEYVRTAQECKDLAQARLDAIAMGYVSGEAVCLGMPELIPGRYFEVESLDGEIDGTYFITKVHHRLSTEEGYVTQLEFKGAKA